MTRQGPGLGSGVVDDWCARAFAAAPQIVARMPTGSGAFDEHAERALAIRMSVLVQQVPPYRALRGLDAVVSDGWAEFMARRYPSHAQLRLAFRGRAADMRPTTHGWIDTAPWLVRDVWLDRTPEPGPLDHVLTELMDRVRRYFVRHSTVGVIGEAGAETGLARLCLLLARFEAGVAPRPGDTVEQIHQSIPSDAVRGLLGLVERLRGACGTLLNRVDTPPGAVDASSLGVAEPVIVRGWAEEDLIIGHTLVAVSLGDDAELARRLRRLVAFAWLDVEDLYHIREVGAYLAASGTLVAWPVSDLAARLLAGADVAAARAEFRELAAREITVPRPVAATNATIRPQRDCAIDETTMPHPSDGDDDAVMWGPDTPWREGWQVTPNGPICPSRDLAELALPFCAALPEGWRLDYIDDPYGGVRPYWEAVRGRRHMFTSRQADGDGLALLEHLIAVHELPPERTKPKPDPATPRKSTVRGSEV